MQTRSDIHRHRDVWPCRGYARFLDKIAVSGASGVAEEARAASIPMSSSRTGNRPIQVQAEPTQPLCLFTVTLLSQQVDQTCADTFVAGVGPGAQLVQVAALGQQLSQPLSGVPVAGVGPAAQDLDRLVQVVELGQQISQPDGGVPVAGVDSIQSSYYAEWYGGRRETKACAEIVRPGACRGRFLAPAAGLPSGGGVGLADDPGQGPGQADENEGGRRDRDDQRGPGGRASQAPGSA